MLQIWVKLKNDEFHPCVIGWNPPSLFTLPSSSPDNFLTSRRAAWANVWISVFHLNFPNSYCGPVGGNHGFWLEIPLLRTSVLWRAGVVKTSAVKFCDLRGPYKSRTLKFCSTPNKFKGPNKEIRKSADRGNIVRSEWSFPP